MSDEQTPTSKPPLTFYRPGFSETAAAMGWKWLTIVPAMAMTAVFVFVPRLLATVIFWKIGWLIYAWPVAVFAKTAASTIKARREPFCIGCGYDLTSLPDKHNCPECGRPYTLAEIDAYRRDPQQWQELMTIRQSQKADHAPFQALPRKRPKSRDGVS